MLSHRLKRQRSLFTQNYNLKIIKNLEIEVFLKEVKVVKCKNRKIDYEKCLKLELDVKFIKNS